MSLTIDNHHSSPSKIPWNFPQHSTDPAVDHPATQRSRTFAAADVAAAVAASSLEALTSAHGDDPDARRCLRYQDLEIADNISLYKFDHTYTMYQQLSTCVYGQFMILWDILIYIYIYIYIQLNWLKLIKNWEINHMFSGIVQLMEWEGAQQDIIGF